MQTQDNMSAAEFVRQHAELQAQSVEQAHETITLTQNDFAAFLDALDAPAPANPALQRALKRHAEQVPP
jgi:uncharacterized protein (DUF1778 family)